MCYDLLRFILCSYDLFSLVDHACRSDARSSPRLERASFSFRTPPPCPSSSVRYDRKIQLKKAPHYLHPFGSCLGYSGVAAQNLCGLSSRLCATNASHSSKKHPTICTHSAPASALLGGGRGVISHLSSLAAIPRLIHRISFELRS